MEDKQSSFGEETGIRSGRAAPVRIWLLGGVRVMVGPRIIGENVWRRQKSLQLVKLLALTPGHQIHRERAAELLWPGMSPKPSLNNLNRELHAARRILQSHDTVAELYLSLHNKWLSLCPNGTVWTDVEAFEDAAAGARRMDTPAAYEMALNLYAGDLLPQDQYDEWAETRRTELREMHLQLLVELAGLYEKLGQPYPAIEKLERAVSKDPVHEASNEALMRLYANSGRRQKALEKFEQLNESLREIGYEPASSTLRLRQDILFGEPLEHHPENGSVAREAGILPTHNLPWLRTSFIGRERELVELKGVLEMTGLLTLTGTGGSGKTRLALEAARELVGAYPGGIRLVELASLADPELVVKTMIRVLKADEPPGQLPIETLLDHLRYHLRDKKLLLVLDNCEHLVEEVAWIAGRLLDGRPNLKILATSREALDIPGELRLTVPPLSLPNAGENPAVEELGAYGAVHLLVDRASLRSPEFSLDSQNAGPITDICRKLEGLPLSLELAASRVATLGAEEVSSRLDDSLRLLSTGRRTATARQETLRATLDWSHDLLEESEKKLFRQLSVFTGGWTLEAARMVTLAGEDEHDVAETLHELIEKSLVMVEPSSPRRYRFLEPIRQYALEHLEVGPDPVPTRKRHAGWFLDLALRSYEEVLSSNRGAWLELLEAEQGNFRAALAWSFDWGDGEMGLQLVTALRYFWAMRGHLQEGRRWLERGDQVGGTKLSRAWALDTLATISMFQSDYDLAYELSEKAISLFRKIDEKEGIASCLVNLGFSAALGMKDTGALPGYVRESEELKLLIRDRRMVGYLILFEGLAHGFWGDFVRAKERFEESRTLHESLGEVQGVGLAAALTGLVALAAGEDLEAAAIFSSTLPSAREFGDRILIFYCLWGLASASSTKRPSRAAVLWGAARSLRENHGVGLPAVAIEMASYGWRKRRTVEKLSQK